MKTNLLKIGWGVIISSLAILTLACTQGYVVFDCFIGWKSFTIFTCISLFSIVSYFLSGIKNWGWLFPTLFFASLALNAAGIFRAFGSPIVAFPLLLSIAIPFFVGYLVDKRQWGWLIPSWILIILALIPPLVSLVEEDLLIALIVSSLSLPFMVGCLSNPECKWSLYIATFIGFIGVLILTQAFIHGASLGPVIVFGTSLTIITLLIIGVEMLTDIILKMRVSRQFSS
jgi:hypothetical protein